MILSCDIVILQSDAASACSGMLLQVQQDAAGKCSKML